MCLLHIVHLKYCTTYLIGYLILLHRLASINRYINNIEFLLLKFFLMLFPVLVPTEL